MIHHIGLDVHKRLVVACILDDAGQIVRRDKIEDFDLPALRNWLTQLVQPGDQVALEVTTNCHAVANVLKKLDCEVTLSNPMATKAIASAKIKTDKVDAHVLAQLLRCGYLPSVWQPDEGTKGNRELVARRASLVRQRIVIKNRIHAVLATRLLIPPAGLFSNEGQSWLQGLPLDPRTRHLVDSDLQLLTALGEQVDVWDGELAEEAWKDARAKLLMTIPGVDRAVAMTLLAAWGDVSRFRDADAAAGYLGLAPSTKQSASKCHHGGITKRGNCQARWMLIQASQHLGKHPGPLGHFFRKIANKKCRNVAVVAVARKLATIAWHMLTRNEPYRYALPETTQAKLARLRIEVTGQKRTTGLGKGIKAKRVLAEPSRAIPTLTDVCQREGLPTPLPLTPGEQKTVAAAECGEFVASIHTPKRKLRNSAVKQANTPATTTIATATTTSTTATTITASANATATTEPMMAALEAAPTAGPAAALLSPPLANEPRPTTRRSTRAKTAVTEPTRTPILDPATPTMQPAAPPLPETRLTGARTVTSATSVTPTPWAAFDLEDLASY